MQIKNINLHNLIINNLKMIIIYLTIIFFITLFLCFKSKFIGEALGVIDKPGKNKIHYFKIPLMGGPIIYSIILPVFLIVIFFYNEKIELNKILYISLLFLIGFGDDKFNFKAINKIFLVSTISTIFFFFDTNFVVEKIYFKFLDSEFYFGRSKYIITIICVILFFISKNMADGINGLIITHSLISILLFCFFFNSFNLDFINLTLVLILIVILFFNLKNQIFFGDSGTSLLAGYFIYGLFYENYLYKTDVFSIISPFLIMGIDMVRLFFLRISSGKHPFDKDNNHFHHILLRNFRNIKSIIIYNFISFLPLILSQMFHINILSLIGISMFIYIYIIKFYD